MNFLLSSIAYAQAVTPNTTDNSVSSIIVGAIRIADFVLGFVVVTYIVYGGYLFMTAGGNPEKLTKAKKALFWAIAATFIIAASYLIVAFFQDTLKCMLQDCPDQ